MSRVVLVGADRLLESLATTQLGDEVVSIAPATPSVVAARIMRLPRRPELVVFGSGMSIELAVSVASAARRLTDAMALVTDESELAPAVRASGITETLPLRPELESVDDLFARASIIATRFAGEFARRPAPRAPGRIVVVVSPKGGVGKTTISCNLAVGLAAQAPNQVVIVDLDLQFGDVASTLGLEAGHSIEDAVGKPAARDAMVLKSFLIEHREHFSVLPAPESPAAADRIEASRIGHLLRQLAAEFEYVIVDTSPGLTDHTLAALEQADSVIAVSGLDVLGVRGLRRSLELLRELDLLPQSRQLVLNSVDRAVGMTVADAERVIGSPVDVTIPRRRAVALGTNLGIPVLASAPHDPAARSLRLIIQRLDDSMTRRTWRDARKKEKA